MKGARIGELLLSEGRLSPAQLKKALQVQSQIGDRLGTTLLELGLVGEDTLLAALGRQRSTRTVSRAELGNISPSVLKLIPGKLAARYRIVPFELRGHTLFVASMDVGDALSEDEIGFLTSCLVRTCIGIEVRIQEALTRYYRVASSVRFKALVRRLESGGPSAEPHPPRAADPAELLRAPDPVPSPAAPPATVDTRPVLPVVPAPAAAEPSSPAEPVFPSTGQPVFPSTGQPVFIELDEEDEALLREPGAPLPDRVAEDLPTAGLTLLTHEPAPATAPPVPAAEPVPAEPLPAEPPAAAAPAAEETLEERLDRAARELQNAEIRDEIADALLDFCTPYLKRRLLLIVRKDRIIGWRGEGQGIDPQRVRAIEIAAHEPSVFFSVQSPESFWLGPLPALKPNLALQQGLGEPSPKSCLVLPVALRSKLVCYLYGDNLEEGVGGTPVAALRRLVGKAGIAFEVYILKNKIRLL